MITKTNQYLIALRWLMAELSQKTLKKGFIKAPLSSRLFNKLTDFSLQKDLIKLRNKYNKDAIKSQHNLRFL